MNRSWKRVGEALIFGVIVAILFFQASSVLLRKTVNGSWNYSVKVGGYQNLPKNTVDVLAFGSSHMYCTLNPLEMWRDYQISSYVLATQQQPMRATYHYVKYALETQKPKVILLETYMMSSDGGYPSEAVAHDAVDPLPWSSIKSDLIKSIVPSDERLYYYLPFLKYHTRWSELTQTDYLPYQDRTDPFRGYVYLTESTRLDELPTVDAATEPAVLEKENLEALQDILDLAEAEDIQVVLLLAPYQLDDKAAREVQAIRQYARERAVTLLDMNQLYREIGLDPQEDFFDVGHLNIKGAQKASRYIGQYLQERFTFSDRTSDPKLVQQWETDLAYFDAKQQEDMKGQ